MAVGSIYLTGLTIPPAPAVNAAAGAQQRTLSAAADRSVIPLIYGQVQATADVLNIIEHATDPNAYLLQVMWCHACDSIGTPLLNGLALPSGATVDHYTGTQTTADSAMVAAFAAKGITYTDTLEGIAYSVLKLPVKEFTGELTVTAVVRGRKVYDPRKDTTAGGSGSHRLATPSTWEWSDNPALCLADWIDSAAYGADDATVWASVPAAADANDALVGTGPTEKRRTLNLAINEPVRIADMAEAMRAYAGCWLVPTRYGISLLPDSDDASVATYSHTSGHIAAIGNITTRDLSSSPTAVEVTYTDDSQTPSRDGTALAALPGAGDTLPWRQSSVRLPGINRYSQALREATERLNKLNLGAYSTTLDVFDIGIRHEIGDIITVSHPAGLVSAPMRITDAPQMPRIGHWRLPVTQHDPLAYDDEVYTIAGYGDPGRVVSAGPPSDVTGFSGSAGQGLIRWRWEPCLDIDYGVSEVRTTDAHWGDPATYVPAFRGRVNEWQEQVTAPGTYTRYIRHYDESGLYSDNVTSATVIVTDADLSSDKSAIVFTPGFGSLAVDATGNVTDYSTATTQVQVIDPAGADVTSSWTLSKADTRLTSSLSGSAPRMLTYSGYSASSVDAAAGNVKFFARLNGDRNDESSYALVPESVGGYSTLVSSGGPFSGTGYAQFSGSGFTSDTRWIRYFTGGDTSVVDNNWEMSTWVKLDSFPNDSPQHYPLMGNDSRELSIYSAAGNLYLYSRWFVALYPAATTTFQFAVTSSAISATTGVWYFVAVSWDNTAKVLRLFFDGVLVGTSTQVQASAVGDHPNYSGVFRLGANFQAGYAYGLLGGMAEAMLQVGGGVHSATYTKPSAPRASVVAVGGYTEVTAEDSSGAQVTGRYEVNLLPGAAPVIELRLTRVVGVVTCNWDGSGAVYSAAQTSISVHVNGIDDTANWKFFVVAKGATAEIAPSLSGTTLNISAHDTITTRSVMISAGRRGYTTQVREYPVQINKLPKPAQVATQSRAVIPLAGDTAGVVADYAGATFTGTVTEGGTDATSGYTWTRTATSGITTTISGSTVTLTAIDAATDAGSITLTGTKSGWPTVTLNCQVIKSRTLTPAGFIGFAPVFAYGSTTTTAPLMEFALRTNGVIERRQGGSGGWTGIGNWRSPTLTGAGTGKYVKAVGTVTAAGGYSWPSAWTSLASDVVISVTDGRIDASILISDSATGTTILGTGGLLLVSTVDAP